MGQVVFGLAPVGGLGARFWLHPNFSIGIDTEIRWIATNTFHAGVPIVPFGEVQVARVSRRSCIFDRMSSALCANVR